MKNAGRAVAPVAAITLALGLLYGAMLVPGVRPVEGYSQAIDVWLNLTVDACVIAVVLLRASAVRRDRTGWLFMGLGLTVAFGASLAYFVHFQHLDPIPSPSLSDAGWLGFYVLLCIGLLLLLHVRVRRMLRSVWLDGAIAGLTAAALAEAYVDGAVVPWGNDEVTGMATLYPLADLLLLAIGVAALAILGRGAALHWWLLCLSFVTFAITDSLYAEQVALGTYEPSDPVDAGWLLARLLLAAAAVASLRRRGRPRDLDGAAILVLPGLCALALLAVLFHATRTTLTPAASGLALAGGVAIIARTAFTFRELRLLTEGKQRALMGRLVEAQDDERARIAADVHDDSLQALAAVDMRLGALRRRLTQHAPAEVPGVANVAETVHAAAVRLRHLLFELETPVLEQGLPDALREAAGHLFQDSGVQWTVEERGAAALPTSTRVSAYRIAREAMVNVLKHARAGHVEVLVAVDSRGVEVHVVDDGVGVQADATVGSGRRHSGVVGMRDRAVASGGWWRSEGVDDGGTHVSFFLPTAGTSPREGAVPAASAGEQPPEDVGRAGNADDELTTGAPAQHRREVGGDGALDQVAGAAGGEHPLPGGRVGLR